VQVTWPSCFGTASIEAAEAIRDQSKQAYGSTLLDARLQLLAIAQVAIASRQGEPGAATTGINDRLLLTNALLQGVGVAEELISEGQYVKAAGTLKQDLEVLARIGETIQGVERVGRTPNVRYAPAGAGPLYGQLNKVAHPSDPTLIATLLGTTIDGAAHGVTYVPAFAKETAVALYEVHVWLLLEGCREVMRLLADLYGPDAVSPLLMRWWLVVAGQLEAAGHLRRAP
jgi:hypothetical protein